MSWIDEDPDESDMDSTDEEAGEIECPYCGRIVSEYAQQCPGCKNYISEEDSPTKRWPQWVVIGVILALAVVVLWVVIG